MYVSGTWNCCRHAMYIEYEMAGLAKKEWKLHHFPLRVQRLGCWLCKWSSFQRAYHGFKLYTTVFLFDYTRWSFSAKENCIWTSATSAAARQRRLFSQGGKITPSSETQCSAKPTVSLCSRENGCICVNSPFCCEVSQMLDVSSSDTQSPALWSRDAILHHPPLCSAVSFGSDGRPK